MRRFVNRSELLVIIGGALTTLAFAPFGIWPLALLGPALLFHLLLGQSSRTAFRYGFLYGLGFMGSGVTWLYVSIAQFGNVGWLFPIAITLLFVFILALFYGLMGWLMARFPGPDGLRQIVAFPAIWVLLEWVRGWMFTGFPWHQLGYSQIDTPLAGYGPLLGGLGVSWAAALSAGLLAFLFKTRRWHWHLAVAFSLLWLGGVGLSQLAWTQPQGESLKVALVQGNIPQAQKWEIDQLVPSLVLYAQKTRENLDRDLVVWPETAVSAFQYQVDEPFLQPLEKRLQESDTRLVFGVVQLDEDGRRYYNAMVSMGADNGGRDQYYKRHLVPFTEYLPLKFLLGSLVDFFTIPMSDFTAGSLPKPLMRVGAYQAGMSICYEDAFGNEMIQALPEAAYLINASNDAWFGDSLAPRQHLQIARMRALESGRYLLRATNTGISAIIGPKGEVIAKSPLLKLDVLKGEIQPYSGSTPYARYGNLAILVLLGLVLMASFPCGHSRFRKG
jgi:apolipoprotein N-acyltransferase